MHDSPSGGSGPQQINMVVTRGQGEGDHSQTAEMYNIAELLKSDSKVKVAGVDFDGILRGKIMSKDKFLSSIKNGFGMSSAIFGWDMHDVLYETSNTITSSEQGFSDIVAVIDLASMRRLPSEDNIAFFFLRFLVDGQPVCADGRGIMAALDSDLASSGVRALAGGELLRVVVSGLY